MSLEQEIAKLVVNSSELGSEMRAELKALNSNVAELSRYIPYDFILSQKLSGVRVAHDFRELEEKIKSSKTSDRQRVLVYVSDYTWNHQTIDLTEPRVSYLLSNKASFEFKTTGSTIFNVKTFGVTIDGGWFFVPKTGDVFIVSSEFPVAVRNMVIEGRDGASASSFFKGNASSSGFVGESILFVS